MSKRFDIGKVIASDKIHKHMNSDHAFRDFVNASLERYFVGDWGDSDTTLKKENDDAVDNYGPIMAYYTFEPDKNVSIMIGTLGDRSETRVQFCIETPKIDRGE